MAKSGKKKYVVIVLVAVFPWFLRRRLLRWILGYEVDATAYISRWSLVAPDRLVMAAGSRIDSLTVAVNLHLLSLGRGSSIGRGNWITGFPKQAHRHFAHLPERRPELILGEQTDITKNHHIDCTDRIEIGKFSIVAGYQSQFLTHSVDVALCRQDAAPITIGDYCFIGTRCIFLGGALIPARSVVGAGSLVTRAFSEEQTLYGGVPAHPIKKLPEDTGFFHRKTGYIW